jgi:hypothetical protein
MKYQLGQIIETDKYLKRVRTFRSIEKYPWGESLRNWETKMTVQKKVMIIGKRTLWNGYIYRKENCNIFVPLEQLTALLVVENLKSNPFYIPMPCD